ncbi:MAG: hypothetical protein QGH93_08815, partial [Gammaproteobacteria bacterium]|nr:hypothetical protein [Gammaproteobacteria bacterium]
LIDNGMQAEVTGVRLTHSAALPIRVESADSANYSVSFIRQGADLIVGPSTTRLEAGVPPVRIVSWILE